ncbi:unnamed protein product [Rotaria magnacalcarata]
MDEGNLDSFNKLLFDNALGNIESSPHTDKQRRWRAKKKEQHHRTQLSLHRLLNESHQYSSDINENFENDVTADDRIFDDNMLVHDSPTDDTHSDVTRAGDTFDDDTPHVVKIAAILLSVKGRESFMNFKMMYDENINDLTDCSKNQLTPIANLKSNQHTRYH